MPLSMLAALSMALLQTTFDWSGVSKALGREGTFSDGVYRINFPRADLKVRVGEVEIQPGFGLTTWAAFAPMQGHRGKAVMGMGDFVVTADELPRVQSRLLAANWSITAVHNHLAGEQPQVMYMHFSKIGEAETLAGELRTALAETRTPIAPTMGLSQLLPETHARWQSIQAQLGRKGRENPRVLNLSLPRAEVLKEAGEVLKPSNGGASSVNFQILDAARIAATGDLILLADEVQPVLKALHAAGITVTALHNHMLLDEPRTFHLHFFAAGGDAAIVQGVKEALSRTNLKS